MPDSAINYSTEEMNGWLLWQLRGRLDRTTAEEAAAEGEKQLSACQKLALDLSQCIPQADVMVGGAEQAEKPIAVVSPEGMVKEILEMARLDMFVTIHASADDLEKA